MFRLWLLIWYFTRPDRPRAQNAPSWYKDEISRGHFWFYLADEKHFREDWKSTLRRWYYFVQRTTPSGTTVHGMKLVQAQKREIDDLIDKAISHGYLIVSTKGNLYSTPSEIILTIDWKGRNFLKPFSFVNAALKEYGYLVSFLSGAGGATILFLFSKLLVWLG